MCEQTSSTGTGAKCGRCCSGGPSAGASGCTNGSRGSSAFAGRPQPISFVRTLPSSGRPATAARPTTGGEPRGVSGLRWLLVALACSWGLIVLAARSCA